MTHPLAGKVAVVTGASAGIGAEVAYGLAKLGATVAVAGRNVERTHNTRVRIEEAGGKAEAFFADFTRLHDVRHLSAKLVDRYPHVDILVNNAGVALGRRVVTHDGFETTFAVNHLAPFLLMHLLRDRLAAAPRARIVTVSSGAHWRGRLDFDDLHRARGYSVWDAYAQSKLANVLFTRALARRLAGSTVTATVCHPGMVATDIWRVGPWVSVVAPLAKLFMLTPWRGADTPIWLASSPDVEGASGGYYERRRLAPTSPSAQDDAAAERLWLESAKMCGVPAH
ncbi:MAG: SDR family oxidoreductase [Alphaproteobacteria bacterium]|nr:SDR family oxidoreductase [Alphaproteobacteria bacterium]